MPSCPACGADIWFGQTDDGDVVPLDMQADWSGPDRYIIEEQRGDAKHVVVRVRAEYDQPAYPDHRLDCPDYGNGRITAS